ncbi:nitroreductase family deazaflavin-dependent oxidoreductase, partial [Streptomyces sp. SID7982]|nr:nitroreductase family deazaflavin-dependent oxidoreductase [Streptomyces sp. SID7982]
ARSGKPHTTPLGYVRDGHRLLVVASNLGAPLHPDWYRNLLAHPTVRVELGGEEFDSLAVPTEGARRDELFARVVAEAPGYAEYQDATDRVLPVVVLELPEPDAAAPPIASLAD